MLRKTRLSYAIAAAVGASAAVTMTPIQAAMLEEVIVTATKRSESAQDIPITIQALGQETLEDLGIGNFKDYIRNLAGVTSGGRGPGRNNIFIRGISAGKGGLKVAGAIGTEPNVALYLDEAPISIGGRNIDAYLTDMNRVEVLPGPQGTLFGASSMAGTVRLITNKPEFNEFAAGFDTSISQTSGGDDSNSVEAYVNLPIIDDKLAFRMAVYNVKEGGYIDNLRGSKVITTENPSLSATPASREAVRNDALVADDFNDASYAGYRLGVKYAVNDDWDILVQHTRQEIETEGVWDYDPLLGDLKTQQFAPDEGDDEFDLTAWTVNGRVGTLDLVYTGSFTERTVEAISDYSGYADRGPFIPYYICSYPGYAQCGAPELFLDQYFNVERTVHEFRLSTDADARLRGLVGVYNDDTETVERGNWNYPASIAQGFAPNAPIPGATSSDPNVRNPGVTFFNDFTRGKKETSIFGELAFDLTDALTASVSARYYDIEISLDGSSNFGNRGVDRDSGNNIDEILKDSSPADFTDTILRFNLQYQLNDDVMFYATWSEGYRPGGFNRNGGASAVAGVPPFVPNFYESDELTNIEFGWKSVFLDGSLRFNGAIYNVEWEGLQIGVLDFDFSNLAFINNTGEAEINGIEIDSIWAVNDNFTLFANLSYNDTEMTDIPPNIIGLVDEGSQLALAPELQYVLRGRYEWEVSDGGTVFTQLAYQYTDDRISSIVLDSFFELDSYATADFTVGYRKDDWTLTFFGENITDELAELFISDEDDVNKTTPNRPRTFGLRFSYRI
ncbi:MAG: iron complex outermembrane receptor protein [Halioglobus sp.]|jgi:iron complex outermembrane receptor protein